MDLLNLLELVKPLSGLYDDVRIVNPVEKKLYTSEDGKLVEEDLQCFTIWGKNKICSNCVSSRAVNENQTYVKIENNAKEAYMVTAIPFIFQQKKLAVEILKNITNSLLITDLENEKTVEMFGLIQNMNTLAIKDGLTNIFNRRYLNERLPVEMLSSTINREPISIIMADIDHFKNVNDTYGHAAGDSILKKFAQILDEYVKEASGWAARFGGEEFVLCLPRTDIAAAEKIAENIRVNIENEVLKHKADAIKITSSFGVAGEDGYGSITAEELLERADKNLYRAKNEGRNRVISSKQKERDS